MQNDILRQIEGEYNLKEAERKPLEATLFLSFDGSVAKREARAYASIEYQDFMRELAALQTRFHFEKRRFSILESAYLAEHASFNREAKLINRHGVIT